MQVVDIENNDCTKTRALLVSQSEWIRLNKILTKNDDAKAAIEETKRLMEERRAASKEIAKSWDSTTLNKRRKELENRKQLLADIEARRKKRDEIIKLENLERRKLIVEKMRLKKWSEKDSTKTLNRAVHKVEILRERALQMEFNEAEKTRLMNEDRLLKIEQNLEAERYRKDRWEQKMKRAETKKINSDLLLKELKEREDKKCVEDIKLKEEGKVELQRIAKEIDEEKQKEKAIAEKTKEIMLKNLNDNRELIENRNQLRQVEEQKENMVIAIMEESRKKIARTRKLKEIELMKEKQMLSEKMMKKTYENQAEAKNISDLAFKKAIDEKEHQYQKEKMRNEELKKNRQKDYENEKKISDEEHKKEKERLALSWQWELERRERESVVLRELQELKRQAKMKETNSFRENLNIQCNNNRMAVMADKQANIKQYEDLIKLWREDDEEFMTHTKSLIDKYEKAGISVIPLLKAIEDYVKNNKLLMNAINSDNVVPNIPLHKVCI